MKVKIIFFDIRGVLFKDIEKYMMRDIAKKYHISYKKTMNIRSKWWKSYATKKISEKEYWKGFLKDMGIQEDYRTFLPLPYTKYIKEMPHMKKLLEILAENYPLSVLSDHSPEWWAYAKKKFQLQNYFQGYVLSFEHGVLKNKPKLFLKAIQLAKEKPEEILFIDNSRKNLLVAKKLGIQTMLFTNPMQLMKELKKRKILV